ncbi:hypothetical protein RDABS01_002168 [Bienertia sinuspersici]
MKKQLEQQQQQQQQQQDQTKQQEQQKQPSNLQNAGFQKNSDEQTPQNMPRETRQMTPPPFNPLIFMDTTPTSMQTEYEKEACDLSLKLGFSPTPLPVREPSFDEIDYEKVSWKSN